MKDHKKHLKPRKSHGKLKDSREKKKKFSFKAIIQFLIKAGVIVGLIGGIVVVVYVAMLSRDIPDTDGLVDRVVIESSKIYDRSGEVILYEIHGDEKRTEVQFEDLPAHVSQAFISIEDKDFYQHNGILPKRLVKAVYDDSMYILKVTFIPKSIRERFGIKLNKIQGASTITQQLVKNAILTSEKKVSRKVKEMILAWQLEQKFSKEQILKMYLNEISYGGVNYGIESAAQGYFGVSAKDLTIAQSAIMAAMINAPSRLSPYGGYKDELISRQQFVLYLMNEQGYITDEEYENAKNEELVFQVRKDSIKAPHFVMYVQQVLEEEFGTEYSQQLLQEGGLNIYTTLDYDLQKLAEESVKNNVDLLEVHNASNAGLVAMNPKNGEVLAMVGSVDYFDTENQGNFNIALANRQPGSSIKPLVFATLFEKGYFPETVLYDVKTNFASSGRSYVPLNYNLKELGAVTIRKALAGSLNIPAVKALYLSGLENVLEYANSAGYSTVSVEDKDRYGLAFVLGGAEVKLLEHVSGYSAFANDGNWNDSEVILRIEDRDGDVLKESKKQSKRILSSESARMINSILSDNSARAYAFGLNSNLVVPGFTVAAKTGTTNNYRDAWTVGYTPSIITGVWAGNNDNTKMANGSGGGTVAAPIWRDFMSSALKRFPREQFIPYQPNVSEKSILNGTAVQGIPVKIDTVSGKLATEFTPEELVEEKFFNEGHSILHYVDKDNPQGPVPENPASDPQYYEWEKAIQIWIENFNKKAEEEGTEKIEVASAPTEFDDIHLPEYKPQITITSHQNNETINIPEVEFTVSTFATNGVDEVRYYISDQKIGTAFNAPFSYTYRVINLENGIHTLRAESCDEYLNCESDSIDLNFVLNERYAPVQILSPSNNTQLSKSNFPLTLALFIEDSESMNGVNLKYKNQNVAQQFITSLESIQNGTNIIRWENPPNSSGAYTLFLEVINNNGTTSKSLPITIFIQD